MCEDVCFEVSMYGNHLLKPVGGSHHDIEGAKEEDKVKEGVAVDGSLSLIIHHILAWTRLLLIVFFWKAVQLGQGHI